MEVKEAINRLRLELTNDDGYHQSWVANIAMAYKDNERWYKDETGKIYLNRFDKHIIANRAAEYFINQLCTRK